MIDDLDELDSSEWEIDDWDLHRIEDRSVILHNPEDTRRITFYLHDDEIEVELVSLTDNGEISDILDLQLYSQGPELSVGSAGSD